MSNEERRRLLLPVDDGATREEWKRGNRRAVYCCLGVIGLFGLGMLGVHLSAERNNTQVRREISYKLLPTLVQPYDINKNGTLERDESYRLFRDYDLQKRPTEKVPTTHFN